MSKIVPPSYFIIGITIHHTTEMLSSRLPIICRRRKIICPLFFWSLAEMPVIKRLIREKQTEVYYYVSCVVHGRYPGKLSKPPRWLRIQD